MYLQKTLSSPISYRMSPHCKRRWAPFFAEFKHMNLKKVSFLWNFMFLLFLWTIPQEIQICVIWSSDRNLFTVFVLFFFSFVHECREQLCFAVFEFSTVWNCMSCLHYAGTSFVTKLKLGKQFTLKCCRVTQPFSCMCCCEPFLVAIHIQPFWWM